MQSNKISFKGQNIYVGIDVHLKTWHVTTLTESGYKYSFAQHATLSKTASRCKRNGKTALAYVRPPDILASLQIDRFFVEFLGALRNNHYLCHQIYYTENDEDAKHDI